MTRQPARPEPRLQDGDGRAISLAVREVELHRRWRSGLVWAVSLSICAAFGWLTVLLSVLGADGSYERIRTNALTAFLAGAICLLYLARPHLQRPDGPRWPVLAGILYLSALGGLVLLGVWLALLAMILAAGPLAAETDTGALADRAWLLSGGFVLGISAGLVLILSRVTPHSPRPGGR